MRLTSFTDYGLRMLMRMASAPERGFSTSELAAEFGLSRHHLSKIMQRLSGAGIIVTRRGSGGGAMLARRADSILLGQVVRVLEQGQTVAEDVAEGFEPDSACAAGGTPSLQSRMRAAEAAFLADLDRSTLADVALSPQIILEGAAS
ncbi:MAG: Rrf2 family transcriptional regulator [Rhodobacterales bacterium]|nr:Rrf2 family transcriptional regulator [Rhodobacterales bacterium]